MIGLCIAGVFRLSGCGSNSTVSQSTPAPTPTDLVVIGNSLTNYGPDPSIGWNGAWGMAATAASKDFVHLVSTSMSLPLTAAVGFSSLELTPAAAAADIPIITASVKTTTLVIIQLGDNVQPGVLSDFAPQYSLLLEAVKKARILICTSTWGKADTYDAMIRAACTRHNGRFVFIGDIRTDPANLDSQGAQFSNPEVNAHPHDWSMARIAERIVAAAK